MRTFSRTKQIPEKYFSFISIHILRTANNVTNVRPPEKATNNITTWINEQKETPESYSTKTIGIQTSDLFKNNNSKTKE